MYLNVCSSIMSAHPKVGDSTRDTRVSLINLGMVCGLIYYYWMFPFPWLVEVAAGVGSPVQSSIILHVRLGVVENLYSS